MKLLLILLGWFVLSPLLWACFMAPHNAEHRRRGEKWFSTTMRSSE